MGNSIVAMSDPYDVCGLPSIRRQVSNTLGEGLEEMLDGFEKEEAKATALFKQYDADASGTLELAELKKLLDTLELPLEDEQYKKYITAMFGQCDVDGSGKIEFREFMKLFRKIFVDKMRQKTHAKKATAQFMKADFVEQQRALFFSYDLDGSGKIDSEEFKNAMEKMGHNMDSDSWKDVVAELKVDGDHDGLITFDEWLHFARKFLGDDKAQRKLRKRVKQELSKLQEAEAWEKFYEYDRDGSGYLEASELREMLGELQLQLTDEQWTALTNNVIDKADHADSIGTQDGQLDFQEFLYFYRKCLRGEDARQSWKESVQARYANEDLNFLSGLDS